MTSISQTSALPSASASASIASTSTSTSDDEDSTVLASIKGFHEGILQPYMGLLPLDQPHDPWTQKAYNSHYPLYSGGGSYEAYLRPRRDTHIMARSHQMLTPDMLERLLRIKAEFQRRFPHLYQGMLNHHTNQTRVVVKPPLLVRLTNRSKLNEEAPVLELGAAEQVLFDEYEAETEASPEVTTEISESSPLDSSKRDNKRDNHDDDDVDYFHFEDDDGDGDGNYFNKDTDTDITDD